ncbi:transcriptional regulator, AraC family [Emticicia oligotrophica DSM 17448]|uniref:Transcriptional regulator, AraC family n=1 Tax=Emticicia oligotrophica (strain DSM 17448 / CIP 109782 / MTCC 6937 / GPTSA100-15) TaxID=929562 RepID=A0ABM5N2T4_EMTOG|nr:MULTISPECIES: AraC family transcriptional regulator [Emticicia]AFK03771.1 transcriptional regulator, AraC family [Emticicia oligotrophica DSM 17448]
MKTPFEQIQNDEGSSFRFLHQKVIAQQFPWNYHYHPEFELVLVFEGTGRRHVGNHLSYYEDGDLVLIGSNLPHAGFGYDALGVHEEIVIQFKDDFLGEKFFEKPEMNLIKKLFERSQQGIQFYGETYEKVRDSLIKLIDLSHFERLIGLLNIFQALAESTEYHLLNSYDTRYDFNQKDQLRLKRIYEYVEQTYQQPINIREAANIAHLTVPAFCNYFKKVVNQTFTDFVNEYRINKACQLLMTEMSITDVCFECGFTNNSYFSKVFKEIKGKSPLEFKKLVLRK